MRVDSLLFLALLCPARVQLSHLVPCVVDIATLYFPAHRLVLISTPSFSTVFRETPLWDAVSAAVHGVGIWPVAAAGSQSSTSSRSLETAASIVIMEGAQTDTEQQIQTLTSHWAWSSRARILFISSRTDHNTFISELWRRWKAADVIVLVQSTLDVYSWRPYNSKSHCGGPVRETIWLDKYNGDHFVHGTNLFQNKVPQDLHGCLVNVSTFSWPPFVLDAIYKDSNNNIVNSTRAREDEVSVHYTGGIEIKMLRAISEASNFQINFFKMFKKNWTDLTDNVIFGKTEVSFGAIPEHISKYPKTDVSIPHFSLPFSWFVPAEKKISPWESLIRCFQPSFWLLVLLSYVLAAGTQCLLGCRERPAEHHSFYHPSETFLGALAVILGMSVKQPLSGRVRALFLLWVLYSVQVNTAYQSMLIVELSHPGLERPITSLQDILNSRLIVGLTSRVRNIFVTMNTEGQYDQLLRHSQDCEDLEQCLHRVATKQDYAIMTMRTFAQYLAATRYTHQGRPQMHSLKDNVWITFIQMCFTKGSLLVDRFNVLIYRLTEAGIVEKWWLDMKRHVSYTGGYNTNADEVVLSTTHLQAVFDLLLLGLGVSSAVFLAEVAVAKVDQNRLRSRCCRTSNLW